jgi:DNA (cytosine-5)-methyltransferase 1
VAELFAGVGGFRLGLEGYPKRSLKGSGWKVVWSNQWEPSTRQQHASDCYLRWWPDEQAHSNEDIAVVLDGVEQGTRSIPEFDLLVGGFPCQDYSVAKTLSHSTGLQGKKGVLWWQIERLLRLQTLAGTPSRFIMLENVDRLLSSPSTQRGRDFAVMLASLNDLGYAVEWRVVNAAEYGFPQKRRRVFILGYRDNATNLATDPVDWLLKRGVAARALPVLQDASSARSFSLPIGDLPTVSDTFGVGASQSPFGRAGTCVDRQVTTIDVRAKVEPVTPLKSVLVSASDVPAEYWVSDAESIRRWKYLKGSKDEPRTSKTGFTYQYKEGASPFPDSPNKPARTILTSEGGVTPSRSKHIIRHPYTKKLRRLIPEELEQLNGFPSGWTEGMPDARRAFMMGNALVVGVVQRLGASLKSHPDFK